MVRLAIGQSSNIAKAEQAIISGDQGQTMNFCSGGKEAIGWVSWQWELICCHYDLMRQRSFSELLYRIKPPLLKL